MRKNTDLRQLSKLLDEKLTPIHQELNEQGKILKGHSKILKSLKKDQDTMLDILDREQMDQRKRINHIETHLGINSST